MLIPIAVTTILALSSLTAPNTVLYNESSAALARLAAAERPQAYYMTCFKSGERRAGMNTICFYDCLGSEAAITIRSTELCPLTIDR